LYWLYFYQQFQQKAKLLKNKELHVNDPLLALPFDSLSDFLPRKLQGQVRIIMLSFGLQITLQNRIISTLSDFYWL
jgi:hypothetical protein